MSVVAEDALKFLSLSTIHNFDFAAAEKAAEVHEQLRLAGKPIGLLDEQIAGHAISLNATLVSNNTKHFSQVPNLKLENWL
jgi:tRNA(fMet)-specific endonuclease VapC